jgi:hypothetical protein
MSIQGRREEQIQKQRTEVAYPSLAPAIPASYSGQLFRKDQQMHRQEETDCA